MQTTRSSVNYKEPKLLFCIGLVVVLLSLSFPLIPEWRTFIHMWRTELIASVFLGISLGYLFYSSNSTGETFKLHRREFLFVALPIVSFIVWSALSIFWAPSWRSALHHTLVWSEYLIFYLIIRTVIDRGKDYRRTLLMIAAAFVLVSLPAIVEYAALLVFGGGTSIGLRYARYGEQVNTMLPLILAGVLMLNGRRFVLGLGAVAALWLFMFVSLGRTNIALFAFGTAAVVGCVFIFKRFHKFRLKAVTAVLVLIAAPVPIHIFSMFSAEPGVPFIRRVNDTAAISGSNGFRKLMASISLEMFRQNPVIGVGADNFGMQLNNYRTAYAVKNPTDVNLVNAENEIPERSHNEFLQILAELGIVGGLIFAWLLCGVGLMTFNALRGKGSLAGIGAVLSILIFLVSSLVTSYSFRLIQNGFVFFFVLAVAAGLLLRSKRTHESPEQLTFSPIQIRAACMLGLAACLMLGAYSSLRVASVIYAARANGVFDLVDAEKFYKTSIQLDRENPDAEFSLAFRLMDAKRYEEASSHFERSISIGRAPSVSYSYLATAYLMGGNPAAAERSFSNAVKMYPLSPFTRTRYAFILQENGKSDRSVSELEQSRRIGAADTATWWTMMNEGARKASENANKDKSISPIMDMAPNAAIYAILFERVIEHPEEKSTLDFMK